MSKLAKLEFETNNQQERIRKEMSIHSENVRLKLKHISDFKNEYDNTFSGYLEKALPKDEDFLRLEREAEEKKAIAKARKENRLNLMGNVMALPPVQTEQ